MFTAVFWRDLAERSVSTGAAAVVLALAGGAVNVLALDWRLLAGTFLGGALLSAVKGLAARVVNDPETASLVRTSRPTTYVYGGPTVAP
jgi:hypothetical protein